MLRYPARLAFGSFLALAVIGCGAEDDEGEAGKDDDRPLVTDTHNPAPYAPYAPTVDPAMLSPDITNRFLPLPPGATWAYESETADGLERIEVSVEDDTKAVWGVDARVVRDSAYLDGELIEDTTDYYAEDPHGNVWYLGEDTAEYENGEVVSTHGTWTAGVDGALPGVVMLAHPEVGDRYRQEYFAGEAEDDAEVLSLAASASVPAGDFTGCVETRDRSVLDPSMDERKYYSAGIGQVLTEEGDVREELVEYTGL